jgi:nitroreductase
VENEILQGIKSRRSIRRYKSTQVSEGDLGPILEAATYAPSGSNSPTWLFTAIRNEAILKELNETARKGLLNLKLAENEYPAKIFAKKNAENPDFNFYYHAPTLIIASNAPNYGNAMADCAAALQNIFLSANSLGLGSCWVNQLRWLDGDPGVRAFLEGLGIPRGRVICGSAVIGYIDGELPKAPPRKAGTVNIIP